MSGSKVRRSDPSLAGGAADRFLAEPEFGLGEVGVEVRVEN